MREGGSHFILRKQQRKEALLQGREVPILFQVNNKKKKHYVLA